MKTNTQNKQELVNELYNYNKEGVDLILDGRKVMPDERLAELLLSESDCTYMRNYIFQDQKVIGIEFDKVEM